MSALWTGALRSGAWTGGALLIHLVTVRACRQFLGEQPGSVNLRSWRLRFIPLDLFFGNREQDFDIVYNAADLTVVAADVFGTGKLPPAHAGPVCWPATWEIVPRE